MFDCGGPTEENVFCLHTNRMVTSGFCELACKGNHEKYRLEHPMVRFEKHRKPVERPNLETVSVLIPYLECDMKYLGRTIASVAKNAHGPVEILKEMDVNDEGHRVLMNRMAKKAKGSYLLRLDAHCCLSDGWDIRMKDSCLHNTLITPMLSGLNIKEWTFKEQHAGLVVLNKQMRNMYPLTWKSIEECQTEEETLSIIGCAYMIQKETFLKSGGCDESLGRWGAAGLEQSLRTWLTGGRVLVRTDVLCGHLFREDRKTPFGVNLDILNKSYLRIGKTWQDYRGIGQTRPLSWLTEKFARYLTGKMVKKLAG
jgi:hypothetical protein